MTYNPLTRLLSESVMRTVLTCFCAMTFLTTTLGTAHAQGSDEQETPSYPAMNEPEQSPLITLAKELGVRDFVHNLASKGVYFNGYYSGMTYSQAAGGRKKGTGFLNDFAYGMDLDLQRLIGLDGARIHIVLDSRFGAFNSGLNNFSGSGMGYQGGFIGPSNQTRLAEFTYEQNLFKGLLNIRVGRIASTANLTNLPTDCQFITFLCGNPGGWSFNANQSHWPFATWGGLVTIKPAKNYYVKTGAFSDNSWGEKRTGFPFSGDWSESNADGTFIPLEGGYSSSYATEAYPKKYSVGFYYDSHNFTDMYYNTQDMPMAFYGGSPKKNGAHTEVYFEFMQTLWKPSRQSHEDLQIFGGTYLGSSGHPMVNAYYTLGLLKHGTFPGRHHDYGGIVGVASVFNQRVTNALNAHLEAAGERGNFTRSTEGLEVVYGAELLPGVLLRPYMDVIFHPDQQFSSAPNPNLTYSVGGGAQIMIKFNEAFDAPELQPF